MAKGVGRAEAHPEQSILIDILSGLVGTLCGLYGSTKASPRKASGHMKLWRFLDSMRSLWSVSLTLLEGAHPKQRMLTACARRAIVDGISPLGSGARLGIVQHLSKDSMDPSFLADVATKEGNQDRLLRLLLFLPRFKLLEWVEKSSSKAWLAVLGLSAFHVILNWLSVQVLSLRRLNTARLSLVSNAWLYHPSTTSSSRPSLSPRCIAAMEKPLQPFCCTRREKAPYAQVPLWLSSASELLGKGSQGKTLMSPSLRTEWRLCFKRQQEQQPNSGYALGASFHPLRLRILLLQGSHDRERLQAWIHARMVWQCLSVQNVAYPASANGKGKTERKENKKKNQTGGEVKTFSHYVHNVASAASTETSRLIEHLLTVGWAMDADRLQRDQSLLLGDAEPMSSWEDVFQQFSQTRGKGSHLHDD